MMRARTVLACGALAATLLGTVGHAATSSPPKPRRMEFRVPALDGGKFGNKDFEGKVVVLDVWATWCGPCRMVIPHLVELHEELRGKGMSVIGLSADEPEGEKELAEIREFLKSFGVTYPIGLLNDRTYLELIDVMGLEQDEGLTIPTTIVLDRQGHVVKTFPGYQAGQEDELRRLVNGLLEADASSIR